MFSENVLSVVVICIVLESESILVFEATVIFVESVVSAAPGGVDFCEIDLAEGMISEKSILECFVAPSLVEVSHIVTEEGLTSWVMSENVSGHVILSIVFSICVVLTKSVVSSAPC